MTGPVGTPAVDHLVVACPDPDEGVAWVEALLGVSAESGGRHEGLGTRNALIGLGARSYLEIVGVDPDQPEPALPRWFGIDGLDGPRLVTWATPRSDLEEVVRDAVAAAVDLGEVAAGARARPDGSELRWRFTDPRADRMGGVVPFFIDWGVSPHPGDALPATCTLTELRAEHPDPTRVAEILARLDVPLGVTAGTAPSLVARIDAPAGTVWIG